MPDDSWIAIRLAILPWTLPDGRRIGTDPAIVRRLAAGDAAAAFGLARHRLQAAGIVTVVRAAIVASEISRRWAVALAFPISKTTAVSFVKVLDPHSLKGESFQ